MAGNTLLPAPANAPVQHQQWIGGQAERRQTWLAPVDEKAKLDRVWSGEFDVERRPSWVTRNSDRWSEDFEAEKLKSKPLLTDVEKSQADNSLVTLEVLEHRFDGYGTEDDPYLVGWIENDVGNPMNFSTAKRWTHSMILAFAVFMVSVASSGFSQGKSLDDLLVKAFLTTSRYGGHDNGLRCLADLCTSCNIDVRSRIRHWRTRPFSAQ